MSFESDIAEYFKENNEEIASKLIQPFVVVGVVENKIKHEIVHKVDKRKYELSICLKKVEE